MEDNNNLPHLPTSEDYEAWEHEFLHEIGWMDSTVDDVMLDVTKNYPIEYTLAINGTPFAPLGGIHGQTGQPGHGKTMTLSMIAAAVLGDTSHGLEWLLTDKMPNPRVLYVDTEMERGNTMLVNKRICAMLGRNGNQPYDDLIILCLREVTTAEERFKKVLKGMWQYRPTVVILDGLIDVVADFNDNVNCQELIFKCMAAASHYNMSLWLLLHQNPGTEKMVGHSGSFLERKASDILQTKKVKDAAGKVHFEVSNKKVRGKDWEEFKFHINDMPPYFFGVPELDEQTEAPEVEEDNQINVDDVPFEMLQPISAMITSKTGLSTREIREGVKQMFHVGGTRADRILEQAVEKGVIFRSVNKRYYLPDTTSEDGEVPF